MGWVSAWSYIFKQVLTHRLGSNSLPLSSSSPLKFQVISPRMYIGTYAQNSHIANSTQNTDAAQMSYSLLQYMFINVLIFYPSLHFYPSLADINFFPRMSLLSTNRKPSYTKLFQLNFCAQITKFVCVYVSCGGEKRYLKQNSKSYLL